MGGCGIWPDNTHRGRRPADYNRKKHRRYRAVCNGHTESRRFRVYGTGDEESPETRHVGSHGGGIQGGTHVHRTHILPSRHAPRLCPSGIAADRDHIAERDQCDRRRRARRTCHNDRHNPPHRHIHRQPSVFGMQESGKHIAPRFGLLHRRRDVQRMRFIARDNNSRIPGRHSPVYIPRVRGTRRHTVAEVCEVCREIGLQRMRLPCRHKFSRRNHTHRRTGV